jgi:tetratricopeptide (TPR) repeat protein
MRLLILILLVFYSVNSLGQTAEESFSLGKQKLENGDHKGAVVDFTNAIDKETYPTLLGTYYLFRGMSKDRLKDYRGAILDITKTIELLKDYTLSEKNINPDTFKIIALAYYERAYPKVAMKNLNAAIIDVNEAIKIDDKKGIFYKLRGEIKILLGQKDSACLDFSRAGELGAKGAYERIEGNCD